LFNPLEIGLGATPRAHQQVQFQPEFSRSMLAIGFADQPFPAIAKRGVSSAFGDADRQAGRSLPAGDGVHDEHGIDGDFALMIESIEVTLRADPHPLGQLLAADAELVVGVAGVPRRLTR
jgi:hypothetical protein